jgi:hypothetical protein
MDYEMLFLVHSIMFLPKCNYFKVSLGVSTLGATKPQCPTQRQKNKPFCGSSIRPTSRCDGF